MNRLFSGWWKDKHPVARRLSEGERSAGFEVIGFPGHTPGLIGLWRESDRTVICADTMRSMNLFTGHAPDGRDAGGLHLDMPESRRSIRKLAALEASTVCLGHGRPLHGRRGGREDRRSSRPACR